MKLGHILFLILLLLSFNLLAADDVTRLEVAKKALQSNDEIEQFRGYNECKTIYLRANLNKDTDLAQMPAILLEVGYISNPEESPRPPPI